MCNEEVQRNKTCVDDIKRSLVRIFQKILEALNTGDEEEMIVMGVKKGE